MRMLTSKILTILACSAPNPGSLDLSDLWRWISEQLASRKPEVVDVVVQEVESLLRVRQFRMPFWNTQNTIKELYDIIPKLTDIAKAAMKEKVIRVAIATLKNLVEKAPSENLASMLVAKLLPFTENLSTRKWSDPDILEDIDYVKERLQENFQSLTTFEQYASEVETGKLEWSPPHKSETFWKENASRLEENNFQLLRQLARILSTATSPVILSVAANDIGQYSKYASKQGKKVLQEVGAKQRVMELMTHEDQDVRYQALSAVQKYMHQAW
ncbi:armadillo-type protein [Zychaea mexicana]|uniref:armadillo-type protein n=1 Tax=Zychaea mexicana TaxID=64656 RepID=UPI0022FE023A|nr:armadillo-type protein [Zychaea mexicana]KAI9484895.1 armadillo-type protein [Zychaea mexicana]